uniref:Uncharacterized protein n=1 Tax=Eutreptiella gymnastica TaxID=73025 RepID=A0A7S1J729_9EUGL
MQAVCKSESLTVVLSIQPMLISEYSLVGPPRLLRNFGNPDCEILEISTLLFAANSPGCSLHHLQHQATFLPALHHVHCLAECREGCRTTWKAEAAYLIYLHTGQQQHILI